MCVKMVARSTNECQNGRTVNSRIYAYMHAYRRICTHILVYAYIYAQQRAAAEPKRPSPGVSHIGGGGGVQTPVTRVTPGWFKMLPKFDALLMIARSVWQLHDTVVSQQ